MSTVCSIFSQVLKLIPRAGFDAAVRKHQAERNAKGFTCWGQFVAMLFCRLGSVTSLRDIANGLAASEGRLRHLGLPAAPCRSTLAYANAHRPWQLFEDIFHQLLDVGRNLAQQTGVRHKFRFKNKLLSIDASTIELCASLFDWAQFRRTKGAVKLHLMLDHDGLLPCYAVITDGKQHEVAIARQWSFAPGAILVFDRGYTDYAWFEQLTPDGVFFVTRLKSNADYIVVEDRPLPQRQGLLRDQSSRPGEFHPQALIDPDLNVSAHPALIVQSSHDATGASGQRDGDRAMLLCESSPLLCADVASSVCI